MKKQTKLILGLALSIISLCFSILLITDVIPTSPKKPKYVFYFIGDGMSFNNILGAEYYNTAKAGASEVLRLNFTQFDTRNFVTNYSASSPVTSTAVWPPGGFPWPVKWISTAPSRNISAPASAWMR
jgi:hypothetical protein